MPFDLSQVLFIATANTIATVAPALQDRMEVLTVPGYTVEEKIHIAQRHLVVKQLERHGLTDQQLVLPEDTLRVLSRLFACSIVLVILASLCDCLNSNHHF